MSLKKKVKRFLKNIIGDLSGVHWRDLDHKKIYAAIGAAAVVIILVIVLLVNVLGGKNEEQPEESQNTPTAAEGVVQQGETDDPLELDAYEEINDLVFRYFYGRCMGDIALLEEIVDVITEEEIQTIERKKDYVEAYKNIQCYTKKGLEEGSYVVFASYEMKIYDIETPAPGIEALYVCPAEDGGFYIFNGEASEELTNYVLELAAEEEVAAVIADVDARYKQLVAEDEDLGKFAQTVLEAQQEETAEVTQEPEAPVEEETTQTAELEEPISTKVTDGIRMREDRSTDSRTLTTLATGTGVKVYASYEDGWSKISYDGMTGYCKTEYLESTEGVPTLGTDTSEETEEEETTAETTEPEDETETESETTSVNKKMKLTDAVRMRSERSTDSSIKKLIYKNEIVTVIESYSDGWSKIKQNDITGYCKTEYLAEAD